MSKNAVGVVVAVVALGAIFYYGHPTQKSEPIPAKPAPTVVQPKQPTKPAPKPGKNPNPAVVYHRVEQGGKQGPEIACTSVVPFAEGKTPAEVAALAKQYGVSVAEVQRWFVCVN